MSTPHPFERGLDESLGTYPDDPSQEEASALYAAYEAEGHLVRLNDYSIDGSDDENFEALVWVATCTCGDSSGVTPEGIANNDPVIAKTAQACRQWARQHRTNQGLVWQQWLPRRRPEQAWHRIHLLQGHAVCAGEATRADGAAIWVVLCSCAQDCEADDAIAACAADVETEREAQWWAAEHRAAHGLEPQRLLPPLSDLFTNG